MKINSETSTIDDSDLEGKSFSIGDESFIFDILRNKIYSNPILAVCREISCNARDAHREVGTPDLPIQIHLPTDIEPFYKIKDWGPGISPDRMENVFIKYGISTKRGDNIQQGCYGIGSKSVLAVTNNYTIITNVDGTQRNYSCFIDQSKIGKLMLLSESPTTEPNGTEIIIPVKRSEFTVFADNTEKALRHWKVKPIIKGRYLHWANINKTLQTKDWFITTTSHGIKISLIVDDIEYSVDYDNLARYIDEKSLTSIKGNIFLNFDIGEISLSTSREQISLDKPTLERIKNKFEMAVKFIFDSFQQEMNACDNLWGANLLYRSTIVSYINDSSKDNFSWNGITVNNNSFYLGCPIFTFSKGYAGRIHRSNSRSLSFDSNTCLYINDLSIKEPSTHHIKKIYEKDTTNNLKSIQVICPYEITTLDSLNDAFHLDKMGYNLLSTIIKTNTRKYTPASSRLTIFKFNKFNSFNRVSYASLEEDTNQKVLCMFNKYRGDKQVFLKNERPIYSNHLQILCTKFPEYSFYGIDSAVPENRIKDDLSDFQSLDDFIEEKIIVNDSINYIEIKSALQARHGADSISTYAAKLEELIKKNIHLPSSIALKKIRIHTKINKLINEQELLPIYELSNGQISESDIDSFINNNPDFNLAKIDEEYKNKYPLLRQYYSYNYEEMLPHIAQYINFCDQLQ